MRSGLMACAILSVPASDRLTGDLYIGDVGQSEREEINFIPGNSTGEENFGWRLREGDIETPTSGIGGPPPVGNVDPIYDYLHGSDVFEGNSVTGGTLYRGPVAELQGKYIFGDFISGNIWSFDPPRPTPTTPSLASTTMLCQTTGAWEATRHSAKTRSATSISSISTAISSVSVCQATLTATGSSVSIDLNTVLSNWE